MTVIVLDSDEESVVLASDSQWTEDTDLVFYTSKIAIIHRGTKAIGAIATAGDARKGLELEEHIKKAFMKKPAGESPLSIIRETIAEHYRKDGDKDSIPSSLLVVRGQGYHIDEDGVVLPKNRWAIGAGGAVALGAMWTRKGTAYRLATFGCKAAIALNSSCGGEINFFEMPRQNRS